MEIDKLQNLSEYFNILEEQRSLEIHEYKITKLLNDTMKFVQNISECEDGYSEDFKSVSIKFENLAKLWRKYSLVVDSFNKYEDSGFDDFNGYLNRTLLLLEVYISYKFFIKTFLKYKAGKPEINNIKEFERLTFIKIKFLEPERIIESFENYSMKLVHQITYKKASYSYYIEKFHKTEQLKVIRETINECNILKDNFQRLLKEKTEARARHYILSYQAIIFFLMTYHLRMNNKDFSKTIEKRRKKEMKEKENKLIDVFKKYRKGKSSSDTLNDLLSSFNFTGLRNCLIHSPEALIFDEKCESIVKTFIKDKRKIIKSYEILKDWIEYFINLESGLHKIRRIIEI